MRGITISDRQPNNNTLAVNLADILQLFGPKLASTEWEISDIECLGTDSESLHQLADTQTRVSGETLLQIASNITQVIDGTFVGYPDNAPEPNIIVRAVDSSAYDVESSDETILTVLRQRFQQVEDLPEVEIQANKALNLQFTELWIDRTAFPPQVLILITNTSGQSYVYNPSENYQLSFAGDTYEASQTWLLTRQYKRVEGRLPALT